MKRATITWLLLAALVMAVGAGLLFDSGSVKKIASDAVTEQRPVEVALQRQPIGEASRPAAASQPSRLEVGQRYQSLDELVADQQSAGFLKTGHFGESWPATVKEIATDRDEIKFVRQNSTPHHYTNFSGYEMKMVRLMAGKQETIVVFRSVGKR